MPPPIMPRMHTLGWAGRIRQGRSHGGRRINLWRVFGGLPDRTGRTDDKATQVARMRSVVRFDVEYRRRIDERAGLVPAGVGSCYEHPRMADGENVYLVADDFVHDAIGAAEGLTERGRLQSLDRLRVEEKGFQSHEGDSIRVHCRCLLRSIWKGWQGSGCL